MRILCTGNEKNKTIAYAVKQKWPSATAISLSTGWDLSLTNQKNIDQFRAELVNYDVFINSSFIGPGVQAAILETVVDEWMSKDIKGHVISIGTTLEWEKSHIHSQYVKSKISLRELSLVYNQQTGITGVKSTYLILGGVNDGQLENKDYIDPGSIADAINWVINFPDRIALLQLDAVK